MEILAGDTVFMGSISAKDFRLMRTARFLNFRCR